MGSNDRFKEGGADMTISELIAWAQTMKAKYGPDVTVWLQGQPWSDRSFELDAVAIVEAQAHFDPTQGPMVAHTPRADSSFPVLVILNPLATEEHTQ